MKASNIIAAALAFMAVGGTAYAASGGEQSQVRFPAGTFRIDATTCRFAVPEADKPLGRSWLSGRIAFAYEDGRHDALDTCLRAREDRMAGCVAGMPATAERVDHAGGWADTKGVAAALASLKTCMATATGIS